jgi:hypothetical protein
MHACFMFFFYFSAFTHTAAWAFGSPHPCQQDPVFCQAIQDLPKPAIINPTDSSILSLQIHHDFFSHMES